MKKWSLVTVLSLLFAFTLIPLGTRSTVLAQGETAASDAQTITYTVQAGDTLSKLAKQYGVTVDELVAWNNIENPDLIYVGQVLLISVPEGWTSPVPAAQPTGGPLSFEWALLDWEPADPDYIATINVVPQGGTPPYTFYHDGLVQQGDTFEIAWVRCKPKPGSVGVADATGQYVKEDYWLLAPYCPVGVEILEPEEDEHLKHFPRHFNITWEDTVDPGPPEYGIEIEVWENGDWHPWQEYRHARGEENLFFVPDEFPGDLGGRVRMWGIYGNYEAKSKTPWRYFEFRVTY